MKKTVTLLAASLFAIGTTCMPSLAWGAENIDANYPRESLINRIKKVSQACGCTIAYDAKQLGNMVVPSLSVKDETTETVLEQTLQGTSFTYKKMSDGSYVIVKLGTEQNKQTVTIKGVVMESSEPPVALPGVNVQVKGEKNGTITDSDGFYSLNVKKGDILVFTCVGFKPFEYRVQKAQSNLIVSMKENLSALDEVVVVGMTEQQRKNISSSVGIINMDNFSNKPITRLSQSLQGGATGINVTQTSGLPGGDAATIKIRGVASLLGNNPLVLVDGVEFDMNKLDPSTIENITILKDAAAASIYGARAGNGVILITTKRGTAGKVSVEYNGYYGIQEPLKRPDFVDAATYMEMVNTAQTNVGASASYSPEAIEKTRDGSDPIHYPNTNWGDLIIRDTSPIQEHNLAVTGGNSMARFAFSAKYLTQDGMFRHSDAGFNSASVRANTSVNLSKNFLIFMDIFANRQMQTQPLQGTTNILDWTYSIPPNIAGRFPEKESNPGYVYYGRYGEWMNPLMNLEQGGKQTHLRDEVLINCRPTWHVTDDLAIKAQFGYRVSTGVDKKDQDSYLHFDYFTDELISWLGMTKTGEYSARSSYWYAGANMDYKKEFGKHKFDFMAGYSQELTNKNAWQEVALMSYYGKLYYSYNDRYLAEFGYRRDGSSLFAPHKKWGNFPSVALGWNMKNEPFMKNISMVNLFKWRASYGILGNNNIPLYSYQTVINNSTGKETRNGNPNITWERVNILNVGVDLSLFKNKLDVTFDWYRKDTHDLIISIAPTITSGLLNTPTNVGKLSNTGWELGVEYNDRITHDLNLSLNVGLSYNKSEWKELSQSIPIISGNIIREKGKSISEYYGYKTMGLLTQEDIDNGVPTFDGQVPGDIHYIDLDGNGVINDKDRTALGSQDPNLTYFANLTLNYKGFDFEGLVSGVGKVAVFYTDRIAMPLNLGDNGGTPQKWHLDYWTPEHTNARFPRLTPSPGNNGLLSDFWKVNGAFARVKYLQLGYNFNSLASKIGAGKLRVYVNVQNPFTFTKVKLIDPETKGNQLTHPLFRTYSVGLNLSF